MLTIFGNCFDFSYLCTFFSYLCIVKHSVNNFKNSPANCVNYNKVTATKWRKCKGNKSVIHANGCKQNKVNCMSYKSIKNSNKMLTALHKCRIILILWINVRVISSLWARLEEIVQSTPGNCEIIHWMDATKSEKNAATTENWDRLFGASDIENRAKIAMCHFMIAHHKW